MLVLLSQRQMGQHFGSFVIFHHYFESYLNISCTCTGFTTHRMEMRCGKSFMSDFHTDCSRLDFLLINCEKRFLEYSRLVEMCHSQENIFTLEFCCERSAISLMFDKCYLQHTMLKAFENLAFWVGAIKREYFFMWLVEFLVRQVSQKRFLTSTKKFMDADIQATSACRRQIPLFASAVAEISQNGCWTSIFKNICRKSRPMF